MPQLITVELVGPCYESWRVQLLTLDADGMEADAQELGGFYGDDSFSDAVGCAHDEAAKRGIKAVQCQYDALNMRTNQLAIYDPEAV